MPVLPCIIALIVILITVKRKSNSRIERKDKEAFWQREHAADMTRKKDISGLDYIKPPFDTLPFGTSPADADSDTLEELRYAERQLLKLKEQPILNLYGISNTELKLQYGVANLIPLSTADNNFTLLIRGLDKWGRLLLSAGDRTSATAVLEYAVSCSTDIRSTYLALAEIYASRSEPDKIDSLLEKAEALNSLTRDSLVKSLRELKP